MIEEGRLIRFDWAIKNILRDKANFDILEGFLSALLNYEVKIINLLESESNQEHKNDKYNRVDLLAEDHEGSRIVIEVQVNREVHYLERLLFGASKLIVENLMKGDEYNRVKKVISVSILYFNYGEDADDYVYHGSTEFRGIHSKSPLKLRRKISELYKTVESKEIFPEYYLIEVEKFQNIIENDLDEWIYFLKNERIEDNFKAKNIHQAGERLEILKMPLKERKGYIRYLENLAIEKDIISNALEDGRDLGIKEGLQQGLQQGREEGREEGLKEGIEQAREEELQTRLENAREMLRDGLSPETVARYSRLPLEKVESLKEPPN